VVKLEIISKCGTVEISLDIDSMRTHLEILKGDLKGVHPMSVCILRLDN
jgi:hypothetical protein